MESSSQVREFVQSEMGNLFSSQSQASPSAPPIYCVPPQEGQSSSQDAGILNASSECLLFEANFCFSVKKYEKALQLAAIAYLLNHDITSKAKALELMDRCNKKISLDTTQKDTSTSTRPVAASSFPATTANLAPNTNNNIDAAPLPTYDQLFPNPQLNEIKAEIASEDDVTAKQILQSQDLFDMLACKPWDPIENIEKAFKKTIVSVHTDRNKSLLATNASNKLLDEMKRFRDSPSNYTKVIEQQRADRGIRDAFIDPTFDREGYGKKSLSLNGEGKEIVDPLGGFDREGKRSYTWAMSQGPKRHVDCNPEAGIGTKAEGKTEGLQFADPRGAAAWIGLIEYSDATSHKFSKSGKYETFSERGVSSSKNGTKFLAKNK